MSSQPYASASLYVGDLAPEVTEALLFEIFKTIGPVASIRVCRDALTRRSLGYAYVNFHNVSDAERAIEHLNYSQILNKQCRIMWSHRDPARRKSGVGNIYIKNLDTAIDNAALYATFSDFGHILSCKVEVDENGVSKGFGYVHYETQEEAEQAISKVNGMLMNDKQVFVGPFKPRKERNTEENKHRFTNVFIKNLDAGVSQDALTKKFAEFGKVTSCVIMPNDKGESKGFGFVNFEKPEDAQKAVEALNGNVINGKPIYVGRAQKKHEREQELRTQRLEQLQKYQGINVYIKNLDDTIDDDRLRQEFSKFGTITSARVMRDDKSNSKGFGFVCFTNPEEATRAVTEMNGVLLVSKPLYVGLAQRKDVRRAQLEALHNQKLSQLRMQQASVMPPMYPNGPPVFFPPGMPHQPRMMYPQQMVPRTRFNAPSGPGGPQGQQGGPRQPPPAGTPGGFQPMPNYVVPMGQRQQQPGQQRGGPRAPRNQPSGGGVGVVMAQGPVPTQPQGNPQQPPTGAPVTAGPAGGPQANGKGPRGGVQQVPSQTRNFKYTSTARNQVPQGPAAGLAQAPLAQPALAPPDGMGAEESKQMIGEQLYSQISRVQPDRAGKITGMLLESLDLRDLLGLLQSRPLLDAKIQEAMTVLHEHVPEEVPNGLE